MIPGSSIPPSLPQAPMPVDELPADVDELEVAVAADIVAVVPVRGGWLPLGGDEAVAEAGGRAVLVGDDVDTAADQLSAARDVALVEVGSYAPAAWAQALGGLDELRRTAVVVLPASPDGRDLAPRLARALGRPLFAVAVRVTPGEVDVARRNGLVIETHAPGEPYVATLQPGVRGVIPVPGRPARRRIDLDVGPEGDAVVVDVLPPDPATIDLGEATSIVAGGLGLGHAEEFELLARVAPALGASLGATRPIADHGWVPFERQIGTTGTTVHPRLYIALGISGAVQHVSGLGDPEHVISVNLDAGCPMMAMADVAIVADALAVLDELSVRLGVTVGASLA